MNLNIKAESIYHDLSTLCENSSKLSLAKFYTTLRQLFFIVLEDRTKDAGFSFAGPLARLDYLLKEFKMDKYKSLTLRRLRARLKNVKEIGSRDEGRQLYDLRTVAEFVSVVYGIQVPSSLLNNLPHDQWMDSENREFVVSDCLRVLVESWTDEEITASVVGDATDVIVIKYVSRQNFVGDHSYLKHILYEGMLLNLIRARVLDNIYYPELIVCDPDFLVDISTVADGFETYGLTPYSYLIKRLKPKANTQAILIGNLASQFLDEVVYNEEKVPYQESIMKFFRQNALNFITCPDLNSAEFHREAQRQQANLQYYTESQLDGYRLFDPERTLLEPSFFSSMLGLQGRIDLLSEDKHLLIEQKSGKWGYHGGHQEKHYVQMLFYLAWIKYNQKISNDDVNCLLLYSKYPTAGKDYKQENGQLKESPAPKLLFQAMMLRNYIVAMERRLVQGGVSVLNQLDADQLNTKHETGPLWSLYQRPEIARILDTVKSATEIERAYFFRFFTFWDKEYHLSKALFASAWNLSMEEKIQEGTAFFDLVIDDVISGDDSELGIETVRFWIDQSAQDNLPNFRKGDVVVCYPYKKGSNADICKDIVFRATITELKKDTITIHLRAPQRNRSVFQNRDELVWAMEHDFLDSSYAGTFRDLFAFLSMSNVERKSWVLNQTVARTDETIRLVGDYGPFNDLVLRAKQAKDYFLVIGPPGTGKTSFALVNILKETLLDESSSVLLVSYTNRAVEEICSKLIEEGIDFIRIGHEHSCTESFDTSYLLKNKIRHLDKAEGIKLALSEARVYVGTTASISSSSQLFSLKKFDLAIVDEASQILEPQLMSLLTAGDGFAIQKFVFIGDQKQLPAVVQQSEHESKVKDETLLQIGLKDCRYSFFERLLSVNKGNERVVYQLDKQGRMHPKVSDYVNHYYYNDRLAPVPLTHQVQADFYLGVDKEKTDQLDRHLLSHRLLCLNVVATENEAPDNVNKDEAELIAQVVLRTWKNYQRAGKEFTDKSVGVIVPYRGQIAMVKRALEQTGVEDLLAVAVDTVERYQGSQREVIVYGTTVRKRYQLEFLSGNRLEENAITVDRKLNVAITRAKEQLVLIGDVKLLAESDTYRPFIDYLRGSNLIIDNPI